MDLPQLRTEEEVNGKSASFEPASILETSSPEINEPSNDDFISLEAEIPEVLYKGMKDFICQNPQWDQYRLMSSALANFLFQNGSEDRAVTERYLNDLFNLSDA